MVGYVQSDSAPYWLSELARKLSEPAGGNLECKKLPVPVSVLASLPDEWITVHGRPDGSEIAVYHIFLDCL